MMMSDPVFGGEWSDVKLKALKNYLDAYTAVMKHQPFKVAYIDAFAGAGLREIKKIESDSELLFDEADFLQEDEDYRHGSPLIALDTQARFDRFIFIEQNVGSLKSLQDQIALRPPELRKKVIIQSGDANECLKELCEKKWQSHRAVAFLDPFALQVKWETIEAIAKTEAIDMWLLFPAMAVNRMLPRSGKIPVTWEKKLTELFGETGWKEVFYQRENSLFDDELVSKTPAIFDVISEYVTERLASIFSGVNKQPLILRNRTGSPLFLLCFASGNRKGSKIALKIAQHIINKS